MIDSAVSIFLQRTGFKQLHDENSLGENALHYAVIWNDSKNLVALIKEGVFINQRGENGFTPLHEAVDKNNKDMVLLLLEYGANKSIKNDLGEKPIDIARAFNYDNIIRVLE